MSIPCSTMMRNAEHYADVKRISDAGFVEAVKIYNEGLSDTAHRLEENPENQAAYKALDAYHLAAGQLRASIRTFEQKENAAKTAYDNCLITSREAHDARRLLSTPRENAADGDEAAQRAHETAVRNADVTVAEAETALAGARKAYDEAKSARADRQSRFAFCMQASPETSSARPPWAPPSDERSSDGAGGDAERAAPHDPPQASRGLGKTGVGALVGTVAFTGGAASTAFVMSRRSKAVQAQQSQQSQAQPTQAPAAAAAAPAA